MNRPSAARTAAPARGEGAGHDGRRPPRATGPRRHRRTAAVSGRDRAEAGHRVGPGRRPRQRPGHDQHAQAHGRAGHGRSGTPGPRPRRSWAVWDARGSRPGRRGAGQAGRRAADAGRAAGGAGRARCRVRCRRSQAQHRDAEGAQGRTGRGPVQPPQPQREAGRSAERAAAGGSSRSVSTTISGNPRWRRSVRAAKPRGSSSGENTTTSVPGGSAVRGIRPRSGVTQLS